MVCESQLVLGIPIQIQYNNQYKNMVAAPSEAFIDYLGKGTRNGGGGRRGHI